MQTQLSVVTPVLSQPWGGVNRKESELSAWLLHDVGHFIFKDFTGFLAVSEVCTELGLHCTCAVTSSHPHIVLGM